MIRNDETVHTMLDGDLRVFARDDALDEQLGCDGVAQAFHKIPIHGLCARGSDFRKIKTIEHWLSCDRLRESSGTYTRLASGVASVGTLVTRRTRAVVP